MLYPISLDYITLCITPFFNLIPFFLFYKHKYFLQKVIRDAIPFLFTTTILFWSNPVRYHWRHIIDMCIVIPFGLLIIFFVLFCKKMHRVLFFVFGIILTLLLYFMYLSRYYSQIEWCSPEHIFSHLLFHCFANISIWFVFI